MSGKKVIFGVVLVLLGFFFLLRSLDIIDWDFGDFVSFILPVALIILGIWFIVRRRPEVEVNINLGTPPPPPNFGPSVQTPPPPGGEQSRARNEQSYNYKYSYNVGGTPPPPPGHNPAAGPEYGPGGRVKYTKFVGDTYIDCQNVDLRNMEVSSFAGNTEIKLHGGKLSQGLNRMVISGFIGDVRVLAPAGMAVLCTSSSFIGDVELLGRRSSGLGNTIDARTENYDSAEAKLYIAVNHFIGDVRVYVV